MIRANFVSSHKVATFCGNGFQEVNANDFVTIKDSKMLSLVVPGRKNDVEKFFNFLQYGFGKGALQIKNIFKMYEEFFFQFYQTEGGQNIFSAKYFMSLPKMKRLSSVEVLNYGYDSLFSVHDLEEIHILEPEDLVQKKFFTSEEDAEKYFFDRNINLDEGFLSIDEMFEVNGENFITITSNNGKSIIPSRFCIHYI